MAKHNVKCCFCNIIFDANVEPFIMNGRRYAHKTCVTEEKLKEMEQDQSLKELEDYIKLKFNLNTISAKIKKQIRDFKAEYNYSYSGIMKSLIWWFDIKKNSTDSTKTYGGIGIVPFIYEQSKEYYEKMWLIQKATEINEMKAPDEIESEKVEIEAPQIKNRKNKFFNI